MTEPNAPSESHRRSQLDWLDQDTVEFRRVIAENTDAFGQLGDWTDKAAHSRLLVLTDLFWQTWYHAQGVAELLRHELEPPLMVVQRVIFEGVATMGYLASHENANDEATIFLAATYLKDVELYSYSPSVVADRRKVLAEMPQAIVDTAKRRLAKHPRTWSGLTVRQLAERAGMVGYDTAYRMFSTRVHAGGFGQFVRIDGRAGETGTLRLGRGLQKRDIESNANLARRNLHSAFLILLRVFDVRKVSFSVPDPNDWQ